MKFGRQILAFDKEIKQVYSEERIFLMAVMAEDKVKQMYIILEVLIHKMEVAKKYFTEHFR